MTPPILPRLRSFAMIWQQGEMDRPKAQRRGSIGFRRGIQWGTCLQNSSYSRAELSRESGLFIENNKGKKCQPNKQSVPQQRDAAEEQSLAEDQQRHGHIHGIADPAIEPGNDQVLRGSDRCGRPRSLKCETDEGIEQDGKTTHDHQSPEDAQGENAEQRRSEAPASNCPGP
jgi:hypothetical protein